MAKKYAYSYGWELSNGEFNEVGAAWTKEAALAAAKELGDDAVVKRKAVETARKDYNNEVWWVS